MRSTARAANNRCRPPSPRAWRCRHAASRPPNAGARTVASCAIPGTCIPTPSPAKTVKPLPDPRAASLGGSRHPALGSNAKAKNPYRRSQSRAGRDFRNRRLRRSEVQRQTGRDRLDRCAANGVVEPVPATDLIAVTAGAEAVMRAHALLKVGADQIHARPVGEPVANAGGILIGRIAELVGLQRRRRSKQSVVDAQHGRIAGAGAGMGVRRAELPMIADALARAGVEVVLGALVEGLERGRDIAPDPFVDGVELQRAEPVLDLIAAADLRGPL